MFEKEGRAGARQAHAPYAPPVPFSLCTTPSASCARPRPPPPPPHPPTPPQAAIVKEEENRAQGKADAAKAIKDECEADLAVVGSWVPVVVVVVGA